MEVDDAAAAGDAAGAPSHRISALVHDISLSPFIVPLLECFCICVVIHFSNARYSRRCTYVLLRTSMEYTGTTVPSQARSLQPRHTRVSARPLALAQPRTRHDPSLRRSHPPLPPRVEENEVHQLLRLRLWWLRLILSMCSAHENTQAMSVMPRGRELAEVFELV